MKAFLLWRKNGYKKNIPDFPASFQTFITHDIVLFTVFHFIHFHILFNVLYFPVIVLTTISKVITSFYFFGLFYKLVYSLDYFYILLYIITPYSYIVLSQYLYTLHYYKYFNNYILYYPDAFFTSINTFVYQC